MTLGGGDPAYLETETDVLQGVHVREEAVGLEDHPEVAAVRGHIGDVVAADEHPPLIELLEPGNGP